MSAPAAAEFYGALEEATERATRAESPDATGAQTAIWEYDRRLDRLSPAERDVYRSVDREGMRPVDLAGHLDRSPSTIRTILHRARAKLGETDR